MPNEELKNDVKKRAYVYALTIIKFLDTLPRNQTCGVISKQLLRSGTSVGANIVEETQQISRILGSSILTLRGKRKL